MITSASMWTAKGKTNDAVLPRLRQIRHVALDMDGTIYSGGTLFDSTEPFLELLQQLKIGYTFLTNNPSKNITDYIAHLEQMGIAAQARGWELTGTRVRVKKHMASAPRRIAKLEVEIEVPQVFGQQERTVLERAALTCPVHETLHGRVEIPVHFRWAG